MAAAVFELARVGEGRSMPASAVTLDDLRRFAVARSLFPPTTLRRATARMGYVQAEPIRAPARAQDLILRHRVKDYRVGDLERHYVSLGIEEDFFVNYWFVTRAVQALMHPRPNLGGARGLEPAVVCGAAENGAVASGFRGGTRRRPPARGGGTFRARHGAQ